MLLYRIDNQGKQLLNKFTKKITNFKSEILDAVDGVMGELKAIRENQEVHNYSHYCLKPIP